MLRLTLVSLLMVGCFDTGGGMGVVIADASLGSLPDDVPPYDESCGIPPAPFSDSPCHRLPYCPRGAIPDDEAQRFAVSGGTVSCGEFSASTVGDDAHVMLCDRVLYCNTSGDVTAVHLHSPGEPRHVGYCVWDCLGAYCYAARPVCAGSTLPCGNSTVCIGGECIDSRCRSQLHY